MKPRRSVKGGLKAMIRVGRTITLLEHKYLGWAFKPYLYAIYGREWTELMWDDLPEDYRMFTDHACDAVDRCSVKPLVQFSMYLIEKGFTASDKMGGLMGKLTRM